MIVTGAGSGIGRASALRFAAEGAVVAALDINAETLAATIQQIQADGGQAQPYVMDATDADAVAASVAQVRAAYGRIDGLFNVAGGSGRRYGDGPAFLDLLIGLTGALMPAQLRRQHQSLRAVAEVTDVRAVLRHTFLLWVTVRDAASAVMNPALNRRPDSAGPCACGRCGHGTSAVRSRAVT